MVIVRSPNCVFFFSEPPSPCYTHTTGNAFTHLKNQIQDMIATDTLVKRGDAGEGSSPGGGGSAWPPSRPRANLSRHDSDDVLGSLLAEGMPDREAAANLEDVPEGEVCW